MAEIGCISAFSGRFCHHRGRHTWRLPPNDNGTLRHTLVFTKGNDGRAVPHQLEELSKASGLELI